jgi:type VI secretion system secreted protein Hcp
MAQTAYYLKIDGIDGESQDSKHKNEIELESFSWGETNSGSHSGGGGGGTGRVAMQDFHFTMRANKASPKLFLACASGEHIKKAVLTATKAGKTQQDYLKWTFSDFDVSSYQTGGSGGDIIPVDQVSFNFAKVEVEYKPQKPDGSLDAAVTAGWKVKENAKV